MDAMGKNHMANLKLIAEAFDIRNRVKLPTKINVPGSSLDVGAETSAHLARSVLTGHGMLSNIARGALKLFSGSTPQEIAEFQQAAIYDPDMAHALGTFLKEPTRRNEIAFKWRMSMAGVRNVTDKIGTVTAGPIGQAAIIGQKKVSNE
jgi:hypothetical protein